MLLRRITTHVKDQNWTAIAIDFVIVVAGILIAFQITEWNETRKDREWERTFLEDSLTELEENRAQIDFFADQSRIYARLAGDSLVQTDAVIGALRQQLGVE